MRAELAGAMHDFLAGRPTTRPAIPDTVYGQLADLADFVTRARSGVFRDGYKRELEYVPEPEAPTRLAKVFVALSSGLAVVHGRDEVAEDDLRIVHRVGLDCIPTIRRRVIVALVGGAIAGDDDGSLDTSRIAGATRFSTRAARYALEDMRGLGIVDCEKGGAGKADRWSLCEGAKGMAAYLADYARDDGDRNESCTDGDSFSEPHAGWT
jgi:hypothetical protein